MVYGPQKPGLHSAIGVLGPIIKQAFSPESDACPTARMVEVLGPSWRETLYPARGSQGHFSKEQQQAAKELQTKLRDYVRDYLRDHVLLAFGKKDTGLVGQLANAVYAIGLCAWPLGKVVTARLKIEDEVGLFSWWLGDCFTSYSFFFLLRSKVVLLSCSNTLFLNTPCTNFLHYFHRAMS